MTGTKRFVSCIYLYNEHAVKGLDDMTIVETDPLRLADQYNDGNVDELLIFDMSYDDESHEKALLIIKEICSKVEIPVIGAGNVRLSLICEGDIPLSARCLMASPAAASIVKFLSAFAK